MFHARFAVQNRLSSTLFGDIWLCYDLQDDNHLVAVKQVHLDIAKQAIDHDLVLDNPWNESQTLHTLHMLGQHENVIHVYQQFQQDKSWFVAMEYCEGGDLWQTLERTPDNRLPELQSLSLFAQIVRGVRMLHANGIAHRDLSLENVLLSRSGEDGIGTAKICDFGLSTNADRVCSERVGKAYYMAPEVVAGIDYDPRAADMWSLGIVLFVLLTGRPVTSIASKNEKAFVGLRDFGIKAILKAWQMDTLVSPVTANLLVGMLQIDPGARFTVAEVAAHPALQMS